MMTSWEQETNENVNKTNHCNSKHTPEEHSRLFPSSSRMLRGTDEPGHSSVGSEGLTALPHMPPL